LNPITGNLKDFLTGVIYISFGSAGMILRRDYDMGTAVKMGPAYFPTILSALLIAIGTVSLIRSFFKKGTPLGAFAVKGLLLVISSTLLFGLIVRGAGLIIALPVLVVISAYASAGFRWHYSLALAAGLTVFCILIFQKGLGVPLPILGSWFGE
jgi:hypothetical protein